MTHLHSGAATGRPSLQLALFNRTAADCNLRDALAMHFEPGRSAEARAWSRGVVREAVMDCKWMRAKASNAWIDYCAAHAEPAREVVSSIYVNLRSAPSAPAVGHAVRACRWCDLALAVGCWIAAAAFLAWQVHAGHGDAAAACDASDWMCRY